MNSDSINTLKCLLKNPYSSWQFGLDHLGVPDEDSIPMKKVFGRLGKQYLKYLAEKLGFIEYEVGYNPSGIACSGDLRLMGMWGKDNGVHIFFNADHVCPWVTYRTIKSLKDYSGGVNQQMSFNELFNLEYIMYLFIGIRKPKYACNSRIVKARNAEYLFEIV